MHLCIIRKKTLQTELTSHQLYQGLSVIFNWPFGAVRNNMNISSIKSFIY